MANSFTIGNTTFTPPPGIVAGTPEYDAWKAKYTAGGIGAYNVPNGGLAANTNAFMTQQAAAPYLANLPNYQGMINQSSANTTSNLKGEIPSDVLALLQQQAAERGVATGSPGSPNSNAAYLRALGLTSLGLQQQGEQNLTGAVARTPVPELFNPASLFVPQMLAQQELSAARSGQGSVAPSTWGRGGAPVVASQGFRNTPSVLQSGPSQSFAPQSVGADMSRFSQNNWDGSPTITDSKINAIANGDLNDMWQIHDPNTVPWQQSDVYQQQQQQPVGTWYNPMDDTSNAPQDDYSSYFD